MRQSILTVVLDVEPDSVAVLRQRIVALREAQETPAGRMYRAFLEAVPLVHFMAITVFEDAAHDPVLMLEANCDGPASPFFAQLEAAIGDELRGFLRCCKPPRDGASPMFQAVVAPDSLAPVAAYLQARLVTPTYGHRGNRGLDRPRIEREAGLFVAAQRAIDADRPALAALPPQSIQARLRSVLLPDFAWLAEPAPPRIEPVENVTDWLPPLGIVAALLAVLTSPFWLPGRWSWVPLAGVLIGLGLVVLWLRSLERRDPTHDAPPVKPELLAAMAAREDQVVQNHMGSIVTVKPGLLRAVLLRVTLSLLAMAIRVLPATRRGYLGSMRTIHFAHWSVLANGGRLLFVSNFDGTWESYLDDFIEKAHGGLTAAWNGCIGFPATRFLVLDGATAGRRFKAWARHSMAPTLFWVSAYPDYTVDEIERHAEVANGLRKAALSPEEAAQWCLKL